MCPGDRYYLHHWWQRCALLLLLLPAGCSVPAPRAPSTEVEFRALLARGSSGNVAATSDSATDERIRTRHFDLPATEVRGRLLTALLTLPRWQIRDTSDAVIWATRTTRLFGFTDDIYLLVASRGEHSAILARSASRIGRSDLGQNRRNLAELWAALAHAPAARAPLADTPSPGYSTVP